MDAACHRPPPAVKWPRRTNMAANGEDELELEVGGGVGGWGVGGQHPPAGRSVGTGGKEAKR